MTAHCVDVCSVSSWPAAKPKSVTREVGVRSSVRLTMPFAANWVSLASDRIFSCATSIRGFSLMGKLSHERIWPALTYVKPLAFWPDRDEVSVTGKIIPWINLIQKRRQRTRRTCGFTWRTKSDFIRAAAGFHRQLERDAHAVRVVRHGDGGVDQHGVRTKFHRFCRVTR